METIRELKQTIRLNKLELLDMFKEYLLMILFMANKNPQQIDKINQVIKSYYGKIKQENYYLQTIINNYNLIRDEDGLDDILNKLDMLNEMKYCECMELLDYLPDDRGLDFFNKKSELEQELDLLIKGLFLSEQEIEEFFYQLEDYQKIKDRIILNNSINAVVPEIKDETLIDFVVFVPEVVNYQTALKNVELITKGMMISKYLGKKVPDIDHEDNVKLCKELFEKNYLAKK